MANEDREISLAEMFDIRPTTEAELLAGLDYELSTEEKRYLLRQAIREAQAAEGRATEAYAHAATEAGKALVRRIVAEARFAIATHQANIDALDAGPQ